MLIEVNMNQEIEDRVLWSQSIDVQPEYLLVVDDYLFIAPAVQRLEVSPPLLHAINLKDGTVSWRQDFPYVMITGLQAFTLGETPGRQAGATPAARHIFLAVTSTDLLRGQGALIALSLTGETRWQWTTDGQSVSMPAVSSDMVAFTADSQRLILLDPADGHELGVYPLDVAATLSAPLLRDDGIFIPARGPELLALDLNGRLRWRFTTGNETWLDRTPMAVGPLVVTAGSDGSLYAIRRRDGGLQWRQTIGPTGRRLSAPISDGRRIFVGARDGLYALSVEDGTIEWYFGTERTMEATPVLVGDTIFATSHDHNLYAIQTSDGAERWRFMSSRRIEVGPVLAIDYDTDQSMVIVADRGGMITAVARPPAAVELQAAGDWEAAATAYTNEGRPERAAAILAAFGKAQQAAQIWQEAGRPEQAAEQYAAAGDWKKAAEAWEELERPRKQAEALAHYAESMTNNNAYTDSMRAAVWEQAAKLFESEGENLKASECWLEVTQYRQLPVITVDVDEHEGLVFNSWIRLQFIVRNDGYGIARHLVIRAQGSQFELEEGSTRQFIALRPDQEQVMWLALRPLAYGDAVPLRVTVHYQDMSESPHEQAQTVYLRVAQTEADQQTEERLPLFTGSTIPADLDPSMLRRQINEYFDLAALQGLCFDLNVDYEGLRGQTKQEKIMTLIIYIARHHRLEELLTYCREKFPNVDW